MANPPRNSPSRRSQDPSPDMDDLFAGNPAPAAGPADPDDWTLEEPAPSLRPRGTPLPAEPIPASSPAAFESNPAAETPGPPPPPAEVIPAAVTLPQPATAPAPSARPAPAAAPVEDPFEMDGEDLPTLPPRPVGEALAASPPPPPALDESEAEDDFSSATSSQDPAPDGPASAPPARPGNLTGLLAAAVLLLGLLGLFSFVLYTNRPAAAGGTAQTAPRLPMAGQLATLSEVTSGWRSRQAGDLVSTVDVSLPTPSRQQPAFVPEVRLTVDAAASKTGFLRFIFLDPDGRISGDVRVVKVNGGTIDPLVSGAAVPAPGSATVYGSLGFLDRPAFIGYASGSSPRWSVEVSESSDYNAKESGWTKLQTFEIRNSTAP